MQRSYINIKQEGNTLEIGLKEDINLICRKPFEIHIPVSTQALTSIKLSGSGDLRIHGKAQNSKLKLLVSSDLIAKKLISNQANVNLTGSGDLSLHVLDKIKANLIGSGDIYYSVSPKQVNIHTLGSGDIHDK